MSEYRKLIDNPSDRIDLCVELTAVRVVELIAKQLERQNISRQQFARLMEVTPGRVSQILDPDSNPQLRTIARALAVLGLVMDVEAVPLDHFYSHEKWVESSPQIPPGQVTACMAEYTETFQQRSSKGDPIYGMAA